jgi:hypothetical protein
MSRGKSRRSLELPDSPSALLAAIDSVLTYDRPAFDDFARSLSALVVCRAVWPENPDDATGWRDPDASDASVWCAQAACGCGGPALPVTRRLIVGLGLNERKSLAWLGDEMHQVTAVDVTAAVDEPAACDCLIVEFLISRVWNGGPAAVWTHRQDSAVMRGPYTFKVWAPYLKRRPFEYGS